MVEATLALRSRTLGPEVAPAQQRPARGAETRPNEVEPGPQKSPWLRRLRDGCALVESVALCGAMAWGASEVLAAWTSAQSDPAVLPGVRISDFDVSAKQGDALEQVADAAGVQAAARPMKLRAGSAVVDSSAGELGAIADPRAAIQRALAVGHSGDVLVDLRDRLRAQRGEFNFAVGYRFVESSALRQLQLLAPEVETPSLPTRLDFNGRKVLPAQPGSTLLVYDSMSAVAIGLAQAADEIELSVQDKPPVEDPLSHVAQSLKIDAVLGSFDTPYQADSAHADRTHNLKVGAAAIDGTVLMPGEAFSFNKIVGERSAEAGYRYATGISAGQLIDVLGGGICQVSSTLFGSAFFGGLEVVSARPHSRPSSYVDMGLDSTVAWPTIDMRLRNPYDFPVVLHMTVSQGKVHAEVLGARRPYQIAFERQLEEVRPYRTVWRDDGKLRTGAQEIVQRGRRGFRLTRTRHLMQAGEVIKSEKWQLNYPATTQIMRRGTNPVGAEAESKSRPALRDPPGHLKIVQ